jgi:hypothetical protein
VTIKKLCAQILRQIEAPMIRRNDSNLLIIKSQIENIEGDNSPLYEKLKTCHQIFRQLNIPMRRSDDWNLSIIKNKVEKILEELEKKIEIKEDNIDPKDIQR